MKDGLCQAAGCKERAQFANPAIVTFPGPQAIVFCRTHFLISMGKLRKTFRSTFKDKVEGEQFLDKVIKGWVSYPEHTVIDLKTKEMTLVKNVNPEFETHKLNVRGVEMVNFLSEKFNDLLNEVQFVLSPEGREIEIVRQKLEEACFFARKGASKQPENWL